MTEPLHITQDLLNDSWLAYLDGLESGGFFPPARKAAPTVDEMQQELDGQWGVYKETCERCGIRIMIVATVESVETGTAEAFQLPMICMTCRNLPGPN